MKQTRTGRDQGTVGHKLDSRTAARHDSCIADLRWPVPTTQRQRQTIPSAHCGFAHKSDGDEPWAIVAEHRRISITGNVFPKRVSAPKTSEDRRRPMARDRQIHRPIVQVGGGRRSTLSETDLMECAGVWTDCERPMLVRKKKGEKGTK
jgi:hypothetical protein